MPSPSDFRKAFELQVGAELGPKFKITSSQLGHDVKEENERYEFPTSLEVEWLTGTPVASKRLEERRRLAEEAFRNQCRLERLVYSAYGSPYSCSFAGPGKQPAVAAEALDGEGRRFRLRAKGVAVRRRDVPTLADRKARERQEAGVPDRASKEDEQRYLRGYRLIKSRFGSSKCAICGGTVDPGVQIAKPKKEGGRGGWAHATCVVQQLKSGGGGSGEEASEGEEAGEAAEEEPAGSSGSKADEGEEGERPPRRGGGKRRPAAAAPARKPAKRKAATVKKGAAAAGSGGRKRSTAAGAAGAGRAGKRRRNAEE